MSDQKSIWEQAVQSEYVAFEEDAKVDVTFVSGEINVVPGLEGKPSYEFDVIQVIDNKKVAKTLGTGSKRLLKTLYEKTPLEGKRMAIQRFGTGYNTMYTVEEL